MFEAGQLVRGGQTAQDIARAAARLAASEGDTGNLVRELQEKQDERYFLDRAYEAEVAQGQTKDNQEQLKKLRKRISKVNEQVQEASIQVQAAFPGYNQLMDASVAAKRVTD
jgi:predicted nuclease with TOPRIM domain